MAGRCTGCGGTGEKDAGHNGRGPCANCSGTGDGDVEKMKCDSCHGCGLVNGGSVFAVNWIKCPTCGGLGVKRDHEDKSEWVKDMVRNHRKSRT